MDSYALCAKLWQLDWCNGHECAHFLWGEMTGKFKVLTASILRQHLLNPYYKPQLCSGTLTGGPIRGPSPGILSSSASMSLAASTCCNN